MNIGKVLLLFIGFLFCASRGVSVYGAEEKLHEYDWVLLPGETLYLPEKGEVLEYDDTFLRREPDGSFSLAGEGEGEIIVRYRIRGEDIEQDIIEQDMEKDTGQDIKQDAKEEFAAEDMGEKETVILESAAEEEEEPLARAESQGEEREAVYPEQEQEQEPDWSAPLPEIQVTDTAISITYDRKYEYQNVPEDFIPEVILPNELGIEVISCSVNGMEEKYERQGNRLVIGKDALRPGKNRVVITVRDKRGNLVVMEPWEFRKEGEEAVGESEELPKERLIQDRREQKLSLGLILLLLGSALVYYEKQKFLTGK